MRVDIEDFCGRPILEHAFYKCQVDTRYWKFYYHAANRHFLRESLCHNDFTIQFYSMKLYMEYLII